MVAFTKTICRLISVFLNLVRFDETAIFFFEEKPCCIWPMEAASIVETSRLAEENLGSKILRVSRYSRGIKISNPPIMALSW